jgi:hypothetical protein
MTIYSKLDLSAEPYHEQTLHSQPGTLVKKRTIPLILGGMDENHRDSFRRL